MNGQNSLWESGVARVSYALRQKVFLCSPSTNTTELEVKNRCKSAKEASRTFMVVILFCFKGDKTTQLALETNTTKL